MPVNVPAYEQAQQHVIVESMQNFTLSGRALQTPLTKRKNIVINIYFKEGKYILTQSQKRQLLRLDRHKSYTIIGCASMVGSSAVNEYLSQKRARSVYSVLREWGVKICSIQNNVISSNPSYRAQRVEVKFKKC